MENLDQKTCPRFEQVHHLVKYQHHLHHHDPKKKGIPENQDPKKPRKTRTLVGPTKNRKTGTQDPTKNLKTGTLEKPKNRDPKKQITVPQWGWKSCS